MKGILFTQDNIRLIREGKKTQTRRLIKPQPIQLQNGCLIFRDKIASPRYLPGELVYVKEAWRSWCIDGRWAVRYKLDNAVRESVIGADENTDDYYFVEHEEKWESPMFLSECFARTFLRIKDVRPERLQDITPEDAMAEGMPMGKSLNSPVLLYSALWDSINRPPHDWAANDWVWVISFSQEARP